MVYDNPCFALNRHVVYRWKALHLNFKALKRRGAPLLGVCPSWRIYGILRSLSTAAKTVMDKPKTYFS